MDQFEMDKEDQGMEYQEMEYSRLEDMGQEKQDGLMAERGMLSEGGREEKQGRDKRQDRRKNAYHNTLLLLQNYRTIAWMLECFPEDIAAELDDPFEGVDRIIEKMDMELSWGNRKLESRMQSIEKTRILMDRLNEALTVLKKKPENGERLYRIIYLTYLVPEKIRHKELLLQLDLSTRHYYRLRQEAVTIISVRLWSAPSAELSVWLETLELLENLS